MRWNAGIGFAQNILLTKKLKLMLNMCLSPTHWNLFAIRCSGLERRPIERLPFNDRERWLLRPFRSTDIDSTDIDA